MRTLDSAKKGSEIKLLMQRTQPLGKLRFVGIKVGDYKNKADWQAIFSSIKPLLSKAKSWLLVAYGDPVPIEICQGTHALIQRCLWHIPHQINRGGEPLMLWKRPHKKSEKRY